MDRSLRRAVLERLAAVEEMAVRTVSVRVARTHLKTITEGWRELLTEHQPDLKGRCPVCSGWLRRRRWPCQVWVTAHRHLIGGEGPEPARWSPRRSNPFRRPRRVEVIPRQTAAPGSADQTGADHTGADQTRVDQTRVDQTRVDHTGADHTGADQTRVDQTRVDQTRVDQTGVDHTGVDHTGVDHTGVDRDGVDQTGASAHHAEQVVTDPAAAEPFAGQFAGDPSEFGIRQTTPESPEVYRAAVAEREPTMPRSRINWRSWT